MITACVSEDEEVGKNPCKIDVKRKRSYEVEVNNCCNQRDNEFLYNIAPKVEKNKNAPTANDEIDSHNRRIKNKEASEFKYKMSFKIHGFPKQNSGLVLIKPLTKAKHEQ